MKTRSKSVPKILGCEYLSNNRCFQSIHERVSNQVYGDKLIPRCYSKLYIKLVEPQAEKPPLMHMHHNKFYEKNSQSSPSTRVKKIKEARHYNSKTKIGERNYRNSIASSKDISLTRQEKSHDLITQASKLLLKEKENTEFMYKQSKLYLGEINLKMKKIKQKFMKICIENMPVIHGIASRRQSSKIKAFFLNN